MPRTVAWCAVEVEKEVGRRKKERDGDSRVIID